LVLDALFVSIFFAAWLRGGGKAVAKVVLCFVSSMSRELLSGGCGGWIRRPVQNQRM
jgi:hypothetical protein